jgi:Ca2+-binding RTX toxin-like protein
MSSQAIHRLVFIDSAIKDIEHLLQGVSAGTSSNLAIVVIDNQRDGIEQISEVIRNYGDIESIHIVSHGQAGLVQLGSTPLGHATLDRYANQLQQWSSRFVNTEILLYGCEVAATAAGKEFVRQLAALTGAKVAASTTPVGNAKLGGDWQLDFATAPVRSALAFTSSTMSSYEFAFNLLPNLIYSVSGNTLHYTSINGGGNFVPVSPTTGLPVNNTLAFATNAIARDHLSANQILYYISNVSNRLGAWDPVTGTATDIAAITGTENPNLQSAARMAFRDDGQLYVMINNNLHTVSTGSGLGVGNSTPAGTTTLVTTISLSLGGNGGDMAFDPANPNVLYITGGGSAPNLYRVTFTGATPSAPTLVGSIGFSSSGLAFGPDGNLYGSNGTRLVRISTIDGSATDVGNIGSVGVNDFATLPTPSPDVDLSISVTDSQVTVAPNGSITYTITVRNNSLYDLRGISIVDTFGDPSLTGTPTWSAPLSAGVTFPTAADQSGTGNINVKVNLAAGATVTYTVTGLTATNTPGATITNTATVAPPEGYTDKASNPGANSATDLTTIGIVDTTPPTVTVNPLVTNDGTPQLTGTIDDPTAIVKVTVNGIEYTATNNGNGTWTLPNDTIAIPLSSGTYDVKVVATDTAGNVGSDTTTNELIVDTTPPVVTVTPLTTADGTPQLTGTIDDPTATVKVTVNGVEYTATNNGNGTWTLADNTIASPLSSGTYDVKVTATDALGNTGSDTTTGELTVDRTPPIVTVNPLTTADSTPQLTGTVDDPNATVKVTVNGVEYTATNNGNGTWTLADNTITTPLLSGTYDVEVTATDILGNSGSDTTSNELIVDTTPPVVTVNSLTTGDSTPQLTGTIDDPTATVKVTVNGVEYIATNNGNGTWTLADNTIGTTLADGMYDIKAVATDAMGNTGQDNTTNELVINSKTPFVLLTLIDSNTSEDGGTGKFQAVLNSKPTANVTLSFSSSHPSEGVPTITTITFTPDNWNTPQIVTVQGKDDAIADGNITYQIQTSVSSNDSNYDGINVPNIPFINVDNDTPGITITPTTNLTTSEAGKTATFTILLKSQPTANVVINLVSSNPTEGTVPKSITFTPTNWNRSQTVTITGVDDALIDGDVRYTIQASVSSSDSKYSQLSPVSVSVTNLDNDRLNLSPIAKSPTVQVIPGVPIKLAGLSATDPDGSIAAYTIATLPPANQGILFLGDPTTGGKAIRSGQTLTPDQIRQLIFLPAPGFTGGSFTYTAMDNSGLTTPPATVSLNLHRTLPPVTSDVNVTLLSNSLTYISNLVATDPDGTIAFYIISTLPDVEQGTLFLGEPTTGGTPIQPGQRLTAEQVQQLVFQATDRFSGASFSYSAVDDMGAIDLTPATVTLSASLLELPTCKLGVYLKGTRQKDRLEGTSDGDRLRGRKGNDVLHGRDCNDIVLGGRGKDRLFGDAGNDTLRGGVGRDRLLGGSGNDLLNGGRGQDRLFGGTGNDILIGKRHGDRLNGNQGNDRIHGGLGRDRIHGGAGNDVVRGGRGNDRIRGGGGDDRLRGNRGRDRLWGGRGNDLLNGGLRPDRLNGNKGNDTILGGRGNDWLRGRQADDVLFGGRNRDRLRGQQGHDSLFGGTGKDRLHGGTGNDVLLGGGGKDVLIGGTGSDRFVYTAMNERGDTIRDFAPTEDVIDLSQIFVDSRYTNPDRFSNYVELIQQGLNTIVQVDFRGEGQSKKALVTLENVNANTLGQQHFLV